jgi:hypothetical protein
MARKIRWAAAIAAAGAMIVAVGCRTAPERTASGGSDTTAEPQAPAAEAGRTGSPPAEAGSMAAGATPFEITGRVDRVDESRIEVAGRTLAIDSSTSIVKGGVGASLEDIREGDEVRATLSGSGDAAKAVRIEVVPRTDAASGPGEPG